MDGRDNVATYLLGLFKKYEQNRSPLTTKWDKNRNAIARISEGFWKSGETEKWRSSTFIGATKQKVIAGYALVIDMVLQGGEIPFTLKPSPEMESRLEGASSEEREAVMERIEQMVRKIKQQLSDCHADREFMKNVLAAASFGETWAKVGVHTVSKSSFQQVAPPGIEDVSRLPEELLSWEYVETASDQPCWIYIPNWEKFWDIEEEDLTKGAGSFQVRPVSPYWLRGKKGKPFYLDGAIDDCLKNRSSETTLLRTFVDNASMAPAIRDITNRTNSIMYLEFSGRIPRKNAETFEADLIAKNAGLEIPSIGDSENEQDGDEVEVMVAMADDITIRYARTTPKERKVYRAKWEENADEIGGQGVADNCEATQIVLNGLVRNIEDNAKLSANVMLAIKRTLLEKFPKELRPGSIFELAEDCDDVRKAVQPVVIPNVSEALLELVQLIERYMDQDSQIPKISQGISVEEKDETAYELSQRLQQAGKYIGTVLKNMDEALIEPIIREFYEYNMNDPTFTAGKGDYIVQALGFQSFQDRLVRMANLERYLAIAMQNPELMKDVRFRAVNEAIAKALDIDPDVFMKTMVESQAESAAAAEAVAPEQELVMEERKAKVAKDNADAASKISKAQDEKAKTDLAAAQALHRAEMDIAALPVPPAVVPPAAPAEVMATLGPTGVPLAA